MSGWRKKRTSSASRLPSSLPPPSARCRAPPIRKSGWRSPRPGPSRAHSRSARPDFIHIATEGPLGLMMRSYCRKTKRPFTTSYHTRFPEYVAARLPVPERWCYALQRRFHNGAAGTFVATRSLAERARRPRLRAADALVARRRYRAVPAATSAPVRGTARLSLCRAHRRREEHRGLSRPRSSRPQSPGRQRPANAPSFSAHLSRRAVHRPEAGRGPRAALMPPPMCSCFRASPTRSASCCSRRWQAAFRSRPFRRAVPRTCSPTRPRACSAADLRAGRAWPRSSSIATRRGLTRLRFSWENSARQFIDNMLAAHHVGLPKEAEAAAAKENGPVGGNRAVSFSCVSLGDALGELASTQKWRGAHKISRGPGQNSSLSI